jgi:hypothetical protein
MTTVQISLPGPLAKEAAEAGLLASDKIAALLREQLRIERLKRLRGAREKLAADPLPPVTADEIQAEISAYRTGQLRRSG